MFREIAPGLYLQPSLLYQTQCAVLADRSGVMCIDPGFFEEEILAARSLSVRLAREARTPLRVLLTHSDFDHIAGAPAFPDAAVVTHATWDERNEARARDALRRFDGEHYIARTMPLTGPVRRDIAIAADGEELGECLLYHTDGHTSDGLALFHRPTRALIVGDYLSDCEFSFIDVGALRYRATLEKFQGLLASLGPALLVSQHGTPALGSVAIAARLDESRRYLDALLQASAQSDTPAEAARRSAGAWRGAIPDYLYERHLENARIALRDLAGA